MSASVIRSELRNDAVYAVIAKCFGVDRKQLTAKTSLHEDLGIDSVDLLALAIDLEEEFDVVVTDQALYRIRTIGDTIVCVVGAFELRPIEQEASSLHQTTDGGAKP
jgi:acyl carrier protein